MLDASRPARCRMPGPAAVGEARIVAGAAPGGHAVEMSEIGGARDRYVGGQQIAERPLLLPSVELGQIAQLRDHVGVVIVTGFAEVLTFRESLESRPIGGEAGEGVELPPLVVKLPDRLLGPRIGEDAIELQRESRVGSREPSAAAAKSFSSGIVCQNVYERREAISYPSSARRSSRPEAAAPSTSS